ncbi:hypothetical protein MPC1_2680002 [Methylocella tundrae]|nr:hypothetical protein MPC1_2680002 [Methylocella tundrae]
MLVSKKLRTGQARRLTNAWAAGKAALGISADRVRRRKKCRLPASDRAEHNRNARRFPADPATISKDKQA